MTRAGLTTERLTRAAAELADEVGFDQVTVSALARRFDVKVASLYSHLAGAQDLRTRIALFALAELADRVGAALAGRAGRDALAAFASAYRDYAHEHPGRYAAAQLRLDPATAATSAAPKHAELARAVLRGYGLAEPDRTHAVRLLGSLVHGYSSLELGGGFSHSAPDTEATWIRIIDAIDALLRNWPDPAPPGPAAGPATPAAPAGPATPAAPATPATPATPAGPAASAAPDGSATHPRYDG
ncbi:TetR/AcrR family transcriptional regulator [Plantactinospora siamensis]|uniref:TetR/AcrR family transcriptional regulator n=1 Tax=Plantactinospora siamensis TaxID=555372 RepID=A0ABV6P2A9_9ACTN